MAATKFDIEALRTQLKILAGMEGGLGRIKMAANNAFNEFEAKCSGEGKQNISVWMKDDRMNGQFNELQHYLADLVNNLQRTIDTYTVAQSNIDNVWK